jgi:hypothetical protein
MLINFQVVIFKLVHYWVDRLFSVLNLRYSLFCVQNYIRKVYFIGSGHLGALDLRASIKTIIVRQFGSNFIFER